MIETTEVRWFQDGALPPSVRSWFTQDDVFGTVEERCDLYRIDGRADVGVKLRARSTLELKARQSVTKSALPRDGCDDLVEPLRGAVEVWQKWSPADELAGGGPEPKFEVHKTVVKRRFSMAGEELTFPDLAKGSGGAFCDVEIVAIDDGTEAAWSFAFAAQGPRRSRCASGVAAWRAVMSVAPPAAWPSMFEISCGYPEWLERRISGRADGTQR